MIPRYTLPEMAEVWSEAHKLALWLRIEVLACEAWARLGRVPPEDVEEIRARARVIPERVAELERVTHHDVAAFVQAAAESVGPAGRWIHLGLTSSDLLDTALALQLRESADLLLTELERLLAAVKRRALEHRDTLCVGRTHGVHAEPTSFGHKLAGWAFELVRDRERLRRAREAVSVGKVSGVVGTYSQVHPAVEEYVCGQLGLRPAEAATQVVSRDVHAEFVAALALTAATLERMALEVRHLARTEVREVEEPFEEEQKGSSAMPHKRNPVLSERICGLARVVRANLQAALEDVALWHERDISHSSVERVILPDSCTVLHYLLRLARRVVEGLRVFPDRMRENLEATGGLVHSQAVLLALVERGMDREQAYRLVQRAAARAWDEGRPFRDLLRSELSGRVELGEAEFEALFDPGASLRHLDGVFARLEKLEVSEQPSPPGPAAGEG
ncbi:MAG TPA: adenylosuccinate lyase [Actinomycetota bacterium]|nr:adenylosuccinate lyase [Actinomycetota bacterium]